MPKSYTPKYKINTPESMYEWYNHFENLFKSEGFFVNIPEDFEKELDVLPTTPKPIEIPKQKKAKKIPQPQPLAPLDYSILLKSHYNLSSTECLVFSYLINHNDYALGHITNQHIAKALNKNIQTISRIITKLQRLGFIRVDVHMDQKVKRTIFVHKNIVQKLVRKGVQCA